MMGEVQICLNEQQASGSECVSLCEWGRKEENRQRVCVCVCVYVREKEGKRERKRDREKEK